MKPIRKVYSLLLAACVFQISCTKKQEASSKSSYSSTCTTAPETLSRKISSFSAQESNWFSGNPNTESLNLSRESELLDLKTTLIHLNQDSSSNHASMNGLSAQSAANTDSSEVVLPSSKPLVFVFKNSCSGSSLASLVQAKSEINPQLDVQAYSVDPADLNLRNLAELEQVLENDPCVLSVTLDQAIQGFATFTDPYYASQAHLTKMNFSSAYTKFYEQTPSITQSVVVAVVDTGVNYNHIELSGQMWTDPSNSSYKGYDFLNNDNDPLDDDGHGTHVAGLIAAAKNASGGVGVASSQVKIMAVKVLDSTGGSVSTVVNGISYAVSKGAQVINMSLGASGSDNTIKTAVQNAVNAGVVVVAAAGNSSVEISASKFFVPAGYAKDIEGMISVGSIDTKNLALSSFSNYSTAYVEIAAPGAEDSARRSDTGGLYSTYLSSYARLSGTSMASPLVAGSAALAIGLLKSMGKTPTPSEIEYLLKASSKRYQAIWNKIQYGRIIDLSLLADNALSYGNGQPILQPAACY